MHIATYNRIQSELREAERENDRLRAELAENKIWVVQVAGALDLAGLDGDGFKVVNADEASEKASNLVKSVAEIEEILRDVSGLTDDGVDAEDALDCAIEYLLAIRDVFTTNGVGRG